MGNDTGDDHGKETLLTSPFCQGSMSTAVKRCPSREATIRPAELKFLNNPEKEWPGECGQPQSTLYVRT